MSKTSLVCASALAMATASSADTAPVRWNGDGQTVLMYNSNTPIDAVVGTLILDSPHHFRCMSAAGCVVIDNWAVRENGVVGYIPCTNVDGDSGTAGCTYPPARTTDPAVDYGHQQIRVRQGRHTIQTTVQSDNSDGRIESWAVDYTIYERPVGAAD
jgi:hypothetical protein